MSYEFTKLSDVPVVAEFPEGANAVIETNGEIKRCPSSGGGSGFEYDFIIKSADGVSFTLETGTYEAINAKVGNQPVKGKIILNSEAGGQQKDMDCVLVGKNGEELLACAFMGEAYIFVVINADNTVTSAG